MTHKKLIFVLSAMLLLVLANSQAKANNFCKPRYAANETYYDAKSAEEINIIAHAEPDLPAVTVTNKQKKQAKSSTNFFTWLTKSHTMPSLHFIEFIELFGDDKS